MQKPYYRPFRPFLFIIVVISLLGITLSPAFTQPARADGVIEAPEWDWGNIAAVTGGAAAGAAIGTIVADGIGAVVGAGVGAFAGWLFGELTGDQEEAAMLNVKETYLQALRDTTANYLNLAHTYAVNSEELQNLALYFYVRKAEYAALQLYQEQTQNGDPYIYDWEYVLKRSEVCNGTMAWLWSIQQEYLAILDSYRSIHNTFVGTYEGSAWGYWTQYDSDPDHAVKAYADANTGGQLRALPLQFFYCSSGTKYVYLNTKEPVYGFYDGGTQTKTIRVYDENGEIWNWTGTVGPGTILQIDLSEYDPGPYAIVENGNDPNIAFFGTAVPAISSSATMYPGLLVVRSNETGHMVGEFAVLFNPSNGDGYLIDGTKGAEPLSGTLVVRPYIWFATSASRISPPAYGSGSFYALTGVYLQPIIQILVDMQACYDEIQSKLTTCNNFAQTYYNALVAGEGEPIPPPDIIFPDPNQMESLDWDELYAIYLAYIRQMYEYFQNFTYMDPAQVNISASSLDLLCRGPVYNETGVMVYDETTIWTPYVSLENMELIAGQNNTMTQPGFLIIWGHNDTLTPDKNNWMSVTVEYVPMAANWVLHPVEMLYQGEPVDSITLNVTQVAFIVPQITPPTPGPQEMGDMEWIIQHWYYFGIGFGLILLLGGIVVRNSALLILGIIVVLISIAGYYIAGDTLLGTLFNIQLKVG